MFYGECYKCGERWSLGTPTTCKCPDLVTIPALKKPWVGLTDEEIEALASWWPSYEQMPALKTLIKDVTNSLKEKNI